MAGQHAYTCPLPTGIHARPASALEEAAQRYRSHVSLTNERSGQTANAKSVLGIVGLDVRHGDACRVTAEGPDEREAIEGLSRFLEHDFPGCDAALPAPHALSGSTALPPLLRDAPVCSLAGTPVVAGIGRGRVVTPRPPAIPSSILLAPVQDVAAEWAKLEAAIEAVAGDYAVRAGKRPHAPEAGMLRAHAGVARDPEFRQRLQQAVVADGLTAAGALEAVERHFTAMLLASESELLRERALDLRDVCRHVLRATYGEAAGSDEIQLVEDSICVAASLTPGQFLSLDRRRLKGLALLDGGTTSHTVILARSFGVPTLVGVANLEVAALEGREVVLDADLGVLFTVVTEAVGRYHDLERARVEGRARRLNGFAAAPATTGDGRRVEVAANVGSAEEAEAAFEAGAEGIGLFRTEMLFLDRDEAPGEEEQLEHYRRAVRSAAGRRVIIRTLDVGGDKPLPYLRLPREDNPFLGYRAVRLYPEFERLFRDQARALVRASAAGPLSVMIPMVAAVEEVRWAREVIRSEQEACAGRGEPFDAAMPVGAMIEVPSAAFMIDHLAEHLDFFSIGTNDLLQYFVAADRANPRVAHLYEPLSPAFVRLLKHIVDGAHARGRWVGLCGELAGDVRALPLLVGLGLDEISLAAPGIAGVKAALREYWSGPCAELVARAAASATTGDVTAALGAPGLRRPRPLLTPELVLRRADCRSKAEAIKTIVDLLYVEGRTDRPRAVEDAVWRREEVYSTGFGHGFAVPHCKTDAVGANSLAVVTLRQPVEWGAIDGEPVGVLLLLAIRESEQATAHMRVLAALARRLMHEDFRARIAAEEDPDALCRFIAETVGI